MSHFTISAIFPFSPQDEEKMKDLIANHKENLMDQLAKKITKPLGLYDINRGGEDDSSREGIFDSWGASDVLLIEDLLQDKDFVSHAIFSPECRLIESPQAFYWFDKTQEKEFISWQQKYREILKEYSPHSFVLLIDCHI
jgi:hypothetical protein